ncbi:MAG: CAP domain-containing protein [Pseudomonadota bacterium]
MSFPSVLGRGMLTTATFLPMGLTYGIGGFGGIVGCSPTQTIEPNNTPDVDKSEYLKQTADNFSTQADTETLTDEFAMTPDTLGLVNRARSVGRKCGDKSFSPAPPLTWSNELAAAALAHARDMADNDYYSHCGRKGDIKPTDAGTNGCPPGTTQAWDRAKEAGYATSYVGENIAMGQSTTTEVMSDWLNSPGHCANIMNPEYRDIGVAFARGKGFLWAMSLGRSTSDDTGSTGVSTPPPSPAVPENKEAYAKCAKDLFDKGQIKACQGLVDACMATSDASARVTLNTDSGSITLDNRESCLETAVTLSSMNYKLKK